MCHLQADGYERRVPAVSGGESQDYYPSPPNISRGWHFDSTNHPIVNLFCLLEEAKKSPAAETQGNIKIKGVAKTFNARWVVEKLPVGSLVWDASCLLRLLHGVFSQLQFKQPPLPTASPPLRKWQIHRGHLLRNWQTKKKRDFVFLWMF